MLVMLFLKHSFFHCYSIFHMVVLPTLITLLFDMAWSANRTSSTSQQQHRVSRVSFPARDPHTFSRQYIDLLLIDHRSVIMWAAQEIGWCNNSRSITHFLLFLLLFISTYLSIAGIFTNERMEEEKKISRLCSREICRIWSTQFVLPATILRHAVIICWQDN